MSPEDLATLQSRLGMMQADPGTYSQPAIDFVSSLINTGAPPALPTGMPPELAAVAQGRQDLITKQMLGQMASPYPWSPTPAPSLGAATPQGTDRMTQDVGAPPLTPADVMMPPRTPQAPSLDQFVQPMPERSLVPMQTLADSLAALAAPIGAPA